MIDFTTVLGVDRAHLEQLTIVQPTWKLYRPELFQQPLLIFYDIAQLDIRDVYHVVQGFWEGGVKIRAWPDLDMEFNDYVSQRERMLAGFVHMPPKYVESKWWLKIDTDAYVTHRDDEWIADKWFGESESVDDDEGVGRLTMAEQYPFIGPSWSYTKPAEQPKQFDDWADTTELKQFPRLNIHVEPGARTAKHRRVCSWVFFCRTTWSREAASLCPSGYIPIPSQDGYHSMVAARRGEQWGSYPAKKLGWANCRRTSKLRSLAAAVLE